MSKVAVLDTEKKVLEPCHPAVARRLLKAGKAAVFKRYPFTIILKRCVIELELKTSDHQLCIDPGSKTTGISIVDADRNIVFAAELEHCGQRIKKVLATRAGFRRGRRSRNLRYRKPRTRYKDSKHRKRAVPIFENGQWVTRRVKVEENIKGYGDGKGWVAPSLMSRVFNIHTWVNRLRKVYPITSLALELVKFDTQLMENAEIKGVEYNQGPLQDYEVREYLLEKYSRKCAYCGKTGGKAKADNFTIDHIFPKAHGGTDRISNLALACYDCNQKKGKLLPNEIKDESLRKQVEKATKKAKRPLKDAAAVNTIRWKIDETLKGTGLPLHYGTGGKTKHNRTASGLPKTHAFDAACVAGTVKQPRHLNLLRIKAKGHGNRQVWPYHLRGHGKPFFGYPEKKQGRSKRIKTSSADGFCRYDHVQMVKKDGKRYVGIINCFNYTAKKGAPHKVRVEFTSHGKALRPHGNTSELRRLQHRDGYYYIHNKAGVEQLL